VIQSRRRLPQLWQPVLFSLARGLIRWYGWKRLAAVSLPNKKAAKSCDLAAFLAS